MSGGDERLLSSQTVAAREAGRGVEVDTEMECDTAGPGDAETAHGLSLGRRSLRGSRHSLSSSSRESVEGEGLSD